MNVRLLDGSWMSSTAAGTKCGLMLLENLVRTLISLLPASSPPAREVPSEFVLAHSCLFADALDDPETESRSKVAGSCWLAGSGIAGQFKAADVSTAT